MLETDDGKVLSQKVAKGKCIVLFYASWCPDCTRFMPVFEAAASKAKVPALKARIDEDGNPIWEDYKIEVVPTVVLFENGKEKARAEETSRDNCKKGLEKILPGEENRK